jgi:hypothetical protein
MVRVTCVALLLAAVSSCGFAQETSRNRDTSLFVYRARNLLMREHGDTIWMERAGRVTRIIDTGTRISLYTKERDSASTESVYEVRGATAYPIAGGQRPVSTKLLRMYRWQVESARRVSALGLPPE